ncbi:MAG: hypothetical protein IT311_07005 [Anaerolineales bacterium]|nr:hypothetical protein [Anaerolineales bacterium]MCZ2120800.1 hypothetical protein [Anaerolineales bacterium]
MNKKYSAPLAVVALGLTMLACAVSGAPTASAPPTTDSAQLNSIVAETVSAALEQTASAPTATSAATATPLAEPSPTPTPPPQTAITHQADGNALFTDEKAKYSLLIPPGWLPVRIDQMEYYDAFSLPQAADPAFQTALLNISSLDPSVQRLFIFDLQDGHIQNGVVNNINLIWSLDETFALENEDQVKALAETLPTTVSGLTVTSYSIAKTEYGLPIGVILSETSVPKEGGEIKLFQKQVFLNLEAGSLTLTFTSLSDLKDATLPFFDGIVESFRLLD